MIPTRRQRVAHRKRTHPRPEPQPAAYGAAKAAVIHYTRTQAAALISQGIRVNCIAPGSIEFPGGIWDKRKRDEPAVYNATLAGIPAKRMGTAEEVANVAVFLASPLAGYITGTNVTIDGGISARGSVI